jgi:molybdopterin biosynthesis enzyme
VAACGGDIVFHRLPIRPGKPILGAVGPQGQAILGLPGNPVSVLIGARWFGGAVLRRRAGLPPDPEHARVSLRRLDDKRLGLWWYRPVRLVGPNEVELVRSRGSGDLVSAARSDGFILMPPNAQGLGPWPFTPNDCIS